MPQIVKVSEVYDMARALYNDIFGDVLDDDTLLPYFKIAYDDLRQECMDLNIPITNQTSEVITVPQGVRSVGGTEANSPALPENLIDIVEVYERLAGTNNDFTLMKGMRFLPHTEVLTQYFQVYTWQNQALKFLGANGDVDIKIDYVADTLGNIVNGNTVIHPWNSKNPLGYRTAALCAEFIGENKTRADALNANASRAVENMLNTAIKSQQNMPVRRRPFMSSYRQRSSIGGWN